jgi:hypothetical protein
VTQKIFNLTQHVATPDQLADGVIEPTPEVKKEIQALLTIEELPCHEFLLMRAIKLREIARVSGCSKVMIGGAPFLMSLLEHELKGACKMPVYSFSKREVEEQTQADGTVKKVAVFKHTGWVAA